MGGINHQPCSKHSRQSIFLSKVVSDGLANLMEANSALEEALLLEVNNAPYNQVCYHWERSLTLLQESLRELNHINSAVEALIERDDFLRQTKGEAFGDSPLINELDWPTILQLWVTEGVVLPAPQWEKVISDLRAGGFQQAIQRFTEVFRTVRNDTKELIKVYEQCREPSASGQLHKTLDTNAIPFRYWFAKVLTGWLAALNYFFVSSLVSTEIYYCSSPTLSQPSSLVAAK